MTKSEEGVKESMRQWVLMMSSVWSHGLPSHMKLMIEQHFT